MTLINLRFYKIYWEIPAYCHWILCFILFTMTLCLTLLVWSLQIRPGSNANEIQIPYDKHRKVSPLVKSPQNTHNSVNYGVIWNWVVPEEIHPPPNWWDSGNSRKRGVKDSGNPGERQVELEEVFCRGHFDWRFKRFECLVRWHYSALRPWK